MEEKDVIESIKTGDTARFGWIVDKYKRQVFTLSYRVTGSAEVADEITQDAFLKIYNKIATWRGDCAFSTWVYRVAYNCAISATRTRKTVATVRVDDFSRIDAPTEQYDTQKEAQYIALEGAIKKLKTDERAIINLFYYDNKSIQELSFILSMSESNVKTKLHRIRKKLADLMQ